MACSLFKWKIRGVCAVLVLTLLFGVVPHGHAETGMAHRGPGVHSEEVESHQGCLFCLFQQGSAAFEPAAGNELTDVFPFLRGDAPPAAWSPGRPALPIQLRIRPPPASC